MSATIELIPSITATRKVENLMVLSPLSPSLPKLLLKPGRWTVGSAATCSYRVTADGVKPRHALLLCGGQTTLLKAWDINTWHNGQPVRGEVRLQPGDHVTVGSVEFSLESASPSDVLSQLPDTPREVVSRSQSAVKAAPEPESWDLEQIRVQIQELRAELSERVTRQPPPSPVAAPQPDAEKMAARVAELEQSADEAKQLAEQTQQELADLRAEQARRDAEWQHDREQRLADIAARELAWNQQVAAWDIEREQRQEELNSLTIARQQLAAESEQRQFALQAEVTRWQNECEQLRHDQQEHQAAWENERTQLLEESRRQENVAQQALQASAQHQQALAEQTQQMLAELQQIETERQQFQAARLESEQSLAELSAERQRVESLAAETQTQVADLTRRLTEFDQQQSQLTRDQRVLEHSWNWVQSDRRKLAEEKEQWQQQSADWQAERESWHAEREQIEAEKTAWQQQRDQWESERQASVEQLEAARTDLQSQQQSLHEEQARLQILRTDWEVRVAEVQTESQSVETQFVDEQHPALAAESPAWEDESTAWESPRPPEPPQQFTPVEAPLQTLSDAWSIGVDLTAPRETPLAEQLPEPATSSDWSDSSWTPPHAEATSPAELGAIEAGSPAVDLDKPSHADLVDVNEAQTPALEIAPENLEIKSPTSFETLDPATAALRRELAEKFQMPGLCSTLPMAPAIHEPVPDDEPSTDEPARDRLATLQSIAEELERLEVLEAEVPVFENLEVEASAAVQLATDQPVDEQPAASPSSPPESSSLEALHFSEDENIDDSVSRYMQNLLARSQNHSGRGGEQLAPVKPVKSPSAESPSPTAGTTSVALPNADGTPAEPVSPVSESSSTASLGISPTEPVHRQDKDALRATTEQMRQIANQQTLKNVQASNWSRLKQSIKTKSCLAAFAFVLSAGLLSLGYYYKQDFFVLGASAAGLGVVTWLDLFIAIRESRKRTSQLAGRKTHT